MFGTELGCGEIWGLFWYCNWVGCVSLSPFGLLFDCFTTNNSWSGCLRWEWKELENGCWDHDSPGFFVGRCP